MKEHKPKKVHSNNRQTRQSKLAPGISRQPSEEEFQMTKREKLLLQGLFDWEERSHNTHWVLGQPLGFQP